MSTSALPASPAHPAPAPLAGYAIAGAAAILFSAKAILAKFLYRYGIDAITLMALRMLMSVPVFATVAVLETRRASARGDRLTLRERLQVVLLGLTGYWFASYLDFLGLQYVTASLERLILFLGPTLVLVFGLVLFGRTVTRRQWRAMAVCYLGLVLVFLENLRLTGPHLVLGSALVFGAAISYAFYLALSGELVRRVGSLRLVAYAMCVSTAATLVQFGATRPWSALVQPMPVYGLSGLNAVFCTVLPVFATMVAISRVGAGPVAQIGVLGPVSLVFLGWWLLGEPVTLLQLAGTAIVLAGVWIVTQPDAKRPAC